MAAAAKKKVKVKKEKFVRPADERPIEAIVAEIADRQGLHEKDIPRFPELLIPYGLAVDVITPEAIRAAKRVNDRKVEKIEARIAAHNAAIMPAPVAIDESASEPASPSADIAKKAENKPAGERKAKKADEAPPKPPKPLRSLAFGRYPATAVIRWMGAAGWTVDQAVRAIEGLELSVSVDTIRIQLRAGAKGDGTRGDPAKLDASEKKVLEKFRKGK